MKIKINESKLKKIINESVKRALKEDCAPNYDELIKHEMHNLWELSENVPYTYKAEIYNMGNSLQAIYQDIQRNKDFDNWNN